MLDRAAVQRWVAGYEAAWRAAGTDALADVFTVDATYRHSPYAEPIVGLNRIRTMWEDDRAGPDEVFTLHSEVVAVDGDIAVVRAVVRYGDPLRQEYTDLWIVRLDDQARCTSFEEWPYWPWRPWSAGEAGLRLPSETL
ncbi:MAG: YybH family protein [Candidatus Limnocylindrales bacterium]|jgi:ketosteroid isomerase-like protein